MPSRKPGKFPNGKAAGTSGGLCQLSTVSCQRPIDAKCRAFAFEWICPLGGRDGLSSG